MHRLNTVEYNATVEDTLGTALQPANGSWRGGELDGFDNMATVLGVDEAQYERYFNAAKTLASDVFSSESLRARFVACTVSESRCVPASLEAMGLRLFRRPLGADELQTYQQVYVKAIELGDDHQAALQLAMRALLSSAEFLYRIERDPNPESLEGHRLNPFELASRLSYFLWSSAPDDALLTAAADGSLADEGTLETTVDHMLADSKAQRFVTQFVGHWLGARAVSSHAVAPSYYQWSRRAAIAAEQEMYLYFSEFLRSDRSWFDFLEADVNFVNYELATLYGMPTPNQGTARVEFRDDQRSGFFGLAGFLALSSFDRRTSPSRRGRWIASNMLCEHPPEPPPNVPKLGQESLDTSMLNIRQILEEHRQSPSCAPCHTLFDPYGLALEQYDAIGQYRSVYPDGTNIDASAELPPDGAPVTGLDDLARAVTADPHYAECVAEKLFTYGLGRSITDADKPHLQRIQQVWRATDQPPSIRRLIHAIVLSEAFQARRAEGQR